MASLGKISIVGCGNIGSTLAGGIIRESLCGELILVDKLRERTEGRVLDILQAMNIEDKVCDVTATDDYAQMACSDVVVVTAGSPRLPGMTRDDLLKINIPVIMEIGKGIKAACPDAFVIVVTNPMDNMTWVMGKATDLDYDKVVGMGGVLDSARFRFYMREELKSHGINCPYHEISAMVLGSHNDSMVPMISTARVNSQLLVDFAKSKNLPADFTDKIVNSTVSGGGTIVKLLGNGSAYVAPAMSVLKMIQIMDRDEAVPCSVYVERLGIYIGLPAIIGRSGVKKIIDPEWSSDEKEKFDKSVEGNAALTRECEEILNELA